ncbi:MAG: hypothetical protein AAFQ82_13940 [Myxococcota bacterium]
MSMEVNGPRVPAAVNQGVAEATPVAGEATDSRPLAAPDQLALGRLPPTPVGQTTNAGTEALLNGISPGAAPRASDLTERSLGAMERMTQMRPPLIASTRGVEGVSPNVSGEVGSSAELAQVVYEGYNGGTPGPISIMPVTVNGDDSFQDGNTYLITISGTEFVEGQATGIGTDANAGFNRNNRLLESVTEAINAAGIPDGADLILAGHSLGGMVAQQAAADRGLKDRFNIRNTVTFGSPLISAGRREGEVRRIADRGDLVPGMSAEAVLMPSWNHFGVERRGGGIHPLRAHTDSYINEALWDGVDALGRTNGNATLEFEPASRMFFQAPTRGPEAREPNPGAMV